MGRRPSGCRGRQQQILRLQRLPGFRPVQGRPFLVGQRGSRFSSAQLVNDLDLSAPDGTVYLGNDFTNGRSARAELDSVNNLEVVLIDAGTRAHGR